MKYLPSPRNTANTKLSQLIHISDIEILPRGAAVFLHAGVGGGKSFFCKNTLYQLATKHDTHILYIINRKNPHDQFQKEILDADKDNLIHITTYQSLQKKLQYNKKVFNSYAYIVFDEYHRFIADSIVDENTDVLLPYIYESTAIKFFLSATPYDMDQYLKKEFLRRGTYYLTYELPSDFSMIQLHTYRGIQTVHSILSKAKQNNYKVLYFSFNIKQLLELSYQYPDSLFVCSDSNDEYAAFVNHPLKENMIETEMLPRRFLFATTCMDIGFNLNDTSIKYVICDLDDVDQIIQCIGRRRIKDANDKVHVYVKNLSGRELSSKIKVWRKKIERAECIIEEGMESYFKKFGSDRFLILKDNLLYLKWDGQSLKLDVVEMMYLYYKHRISVYEKILQSGLSYKNYWMQYVLTTCPSSDRRMRLLQVLKKYCDMELSVSDRAKFYKELKLYDDNRNLITKPEVINKILKDLNLLYEIAVIQKTRRIKRLKVIEK